MAIWIGGKDGPKQSLVWLIEMPRDILELCPGRWYGKRISVVRQESGPLIWIGKEIGAIDQTFRTVVIRKPIDGLPHLLGSGQYRYPALRIIRHRGSVHRRLEIGQRTR